MKVNKNFTILLLISTIFMFGMFILKFVDQQSTITITEEGFSPKVKTVKHLSKIRFINSSSTGHWIASDSHPTHEMYPDFDSKKAIMPGEEWEIEIKRGGEISYHDHINPQFTGVIKVIGGGSGETVNDKKELLNKINAVVNEKSAREAYSYLVMNYPSYHPYAHDIAHYLGKIIYKEEGATGIEVCDTSFGFGCYHGFIPDYITDQGTSKIPELSKECLKREIPYGQLSCFHGIGHGIVSYHKYDVKTSLKICDKYFKGDFLHTCYTGIFMENPNDSVDLCKSVGKQYKTACYEYIHESISLSGDSGMVIKEIIGICTLVESGYVPSCYKSVGRFIGQVTRADDSRVHEYCGWIPAENGKENCIKSVIEVWRLYKVEEINIKLLCDDLLSTFGEKCKPRVISS